MGARNRNRCLEDMPSQAAGETTAGFSWERPGPPYILGFALEEKKKKKKHGQLEFCFLTAIPQPALLKQVLWRHRMSG